MLLQPVELVLYHMEIKALGQMLRYGLTRSSKSILFSVDFFNGSSRNLYKCPNANHRLTE